MSNRFIPKRFNEIDLEPYGGEGKLILRPKTKMMDSKLAQRVVKLSNELGIDFNEDNEDVITALFAHDITVQTFQECIVVPEGEEPITEEEILRFPDELVEAIFDILNTGAEFPLGGPGQEKGQKKEQ